MTTQHDEAVERVARALCLNDLRGRSDFETAWEHESPVWLDEAKCAIDTYTALSATAAPAGEVERLRGELRRIAEGNLGDQPWQANYDKIREVAKAALANDTEAR